MHRSLGAFVLIACVVGHRVPVPAAAAARPPLVDLLDRYAAHDFEAPVALAGMSWKDADEVATELELKGPAWTEARGPRDAAPRRLVAATFALDLARVWSATLIYRNWPASRRLVVWGCETLRKNPTPLAAERWWHLAAVALFEGRQDVPSLVGSTVRPLPMNAIDGPEGHMAHALERFPGEPRLLLGQVVAQEMSTWSVGYRAGVLLTAVQEESGHLEGLRASSRQFGALLGVDAIAAEAHVRLGYTMMRLGDPAGGLPHLAYVEALSTDPVLLYIARTYAGLAQERLAQPLDAIASYRRALEVAPAARTAGLALTSLLIRESRAADAYDVANELFLHPTAIDPFGRYRTGDYRFVVDYLDQLKRALP